MHPPFARGVTSLMYVGDAELERTTKMSSAVYALGAVAIAGGVIGVPKKARQISAVLAVAVFVSL